MHPVNCLGQCISTGGCRCVAVLCHGGSGVIRGGSTRRCGPKWSHTKLSNLHVQSAPDNRDAIHPGLGFREPLALKTLVVICLPTKLHVYGYAARVSRNMPTRSAPEVDYIWGIWGSSYNIPKAIFYLLKGS